MIPTEALEAIIAGTADPCPFCGLPMVRQTDYRGLAYWAHTAHARAVTHRDCPAITFVWFEQEDEPEKLEAWNRRSSPEVVRAMATELVAYQRAEK